MTSNRSRQLATNIYTEIYGQPDIDDPYAERTIINIAIWLQYAEANGTDDIEIITNQWLAYAAKIYNPEQERAESLLSLSRRAIELGNE